MDFSGQLFDKHDTAIPLLLLAVGGACLVLVICLFPVLLRHDQSSSGKACRPDEPYPGASVLRPMATASALSPLQRYALHSGLLGVLLQVDVLLIENW